MKLLAKDYGFESHCLQECFHFLILAYFVFRAGRFSRYKLNQPRQTPYLVFARELHVHMFIKVEVSFCITFIVMSEVSVYVYITANRSFN